MLFYYPGVLINGYFAVKLFLFHVEHIHNYDFQLII